jgi:hypothetical protein
LWGRKRNNIIGHELFFRLGLSHNSLENYYLSNFAMIQHHKWSLTELEDMLPYERDIYVAMLKNWIEEENERIRQQQNTR